MSAPRIIDPSPEENARARAIVRERLDAFIADTARAMGDQRLSIKALAAKMLIEDFAALDPNAAQLWLAASSWEIEPLEAERREHFVHERRRAFEQLAQAEISRAAERCP